MNNRDQTRLLSDMEKQVTAVRRALDQMMQVTMPVTPCLCFVDAEWPLGSRAFQLAGVWVSWPKRVIELILESGPVTPDVIDYLSRELSARLPRNS